MKIEISGGIGNQLFQYSFGRYIQNRAKVEVEFIGAPLGFREDVHNSSLSDFNFLGSLKIRSYSAITNFLSRVDRFGGILFPVLNSYRMKLFGTYTQIGIGYDEEFFLRSIPNYVRGYFQSYVYPSEIKEELVNKFQLVTPTQDFENHAQRARQTKPIMMHVRRGDYEGLRESVGLLGAEYYLQGIQYLRQKLPGSEVWIFTDSPEKIGNLVELIGLGGIDEIRVVSGLSDSESLKLMSMGGGIVIANSTYSWWAAFLGEYDEMVVAPQPWFKALSDPQKLIPPDWKTLPSLWE